MHGKLIPRSKFQPHSRRLNKTVCETQIEVSTEITPQTAAEVVQ